MHTVDVTAPSRSYTITIGSGLRKQPYVYLPAGWAQSINHLLILTDERVASLYLDEVYAAYAEQLPVDTYVLPAGEGSKSFSGYEEAVSACVHAGLDRDSGIVALGGGVIGDLTGFVAATYMRGISFIQMPTTLLAHDSSVGGKTGINHPDGKNMIGAFHHPDAVLYDVDTLGSLPREEWLCGFGEVIKHGYIADQQMLDQVRHMQPLSESFTISDQLLAASINVKRDIVNEDEHEHGIRAHLNFGHTLAHTLEQTTGYGALTHGEAVVNGMVFAMYVGRQLGYAGPEPFEALNWLRSFGYSFQPLQQMDTPGILQGMKKDKKTRAGTVRYVVLAEAQQPVIVEIADEELFSLLDSFKKEMEFT